MFSVISNTWALLIGMMLLMVGNGLQSTLLGVRGEIEGFSTFEMSAIMSAYFLGFMFASRMVPKMIQRVGHVRVFAALGSFVSAALIIFPVVSDPIIWALARVVIGFSFCGVYITAESWLNNSVTNETRGQALSAYMIVQMVGIVAAQWMLNLADPSGYSLFILMSILVSLSFAPILLSVNPTPAYEQTKPMSLKQLIETSPLACMGMFLLGGVFSAQFGMSAVFASKIGLKVSEISIFVAAFYVGAMLLQYPIGWVSDRIDRRLLIMIVSLGGAIPAAAAVVMGGNFVVLAVSAFFIGGFSNPLYSLLIAHANDYLEYEDMAAASGGLLFINGIGAISGPLVIGWVMDTFGPYGFFYIIVGLLGGLALYASYRMTQRSGTSVEDLASYTTVLPTGSPVALEVAMEYDIETAIEEENDGNPS